MSKTAVDWSAVRQEIKAQMPKLHVPEAVAGSVAGAGAGALYHAIKGSESGGGDLWRRVLLGAVLGGAGTNLVGDRVRRGLTNQPTLFAYNLDKQVDGLRQAGLGGLWRSMILDKPVELPAKEHAAGYSETARLMRRELFRRGLNVHTPGKEDFFSQVGQEASGSPVLHLNSRFTGADGRLTDAAEKVWGQIRPYNVTENVTNNVSGQLPARGSVLKNFTQKVRGNDVHLQDKWDFDLHPHEYEALMKGLPTFLQAEPDDKWALGALAARWLMSKTLAGRMPVYSQAFRVPSAPAMQESGDKLNQWMWEQGARPSPL